MTNDDERGEGGKKCRKYDDVICERPQCNLQNLILNSLSSLLKLPKLEISILTIIV